MRCVRIRFTKTGRMIYVSHLDINRLMTRAVRRAELPMWYTEGFNPHPYIAFALPLSLGQSSECEFMDIKIETDMTNQEVYERLSSVMPQGMNILEVSDPTFDINDISAAKYEVRLVFNNESEATGFFEKSKEILDGDELLAEKKGKKGHRKVMKTVNLIEQIYEKNIEQKGSEVNLYLTVCAGNTANLNPALLTEALQNQTGINYDMQYIQRTALVAKNIIF